MIALRQQKKILIIDEINYTRLALDHALTSAGYKVATAHSSEEAMQHISAELPDIILLSLRTVDPSRASILATLKDYFKMRLDIAQGAEPPVITLSASRNTKQIHELQSLGVSRILFKPINMQELFDSITSAIANKKKVTMQTRKKLMIFDGETRSQQFLESILMHEIYDIEAADSEAELLARIKHGRFDLLIVDLASLESDINETLRSIREIAVEVPIVTLAGSADAAFLSQVAECEEKEGKPQDSPESRVLSLGSYVHFTKPLNIDEFRTEVDTLLETQVERTLAHAPEHDGENPPYP